MRLIAIPIARARAGVTPVSTFLAQQTPIKPSFTPHQLAGTAASKAAAASSKNPSTTDPSPSSPATSSSNSSPKASKDDTEAKPPLSKRLMDKASQFWIDLGREDQTSTFDWKRRTYTLGEKLMDQIEYEEWALKGVDPAMGPSLTAPIGKKATSTTESGPVSKAISEAKESSAPTEPKKIPLLFPSSHLTSNSLLSSLTHLTASRQPHHRQRMIWCIVGMPFTIPFIVVPVVPNLPFFYLVWRAWSHWRAFQSSKYLNDLIKQGRVIPTPSEELDRIFALPEPAPPPQSDEKKASEASVTTASDGSTSTTTKTDTNEPTKSDVNYEPLMILKLFHISTLAKTFNLDRQLSVDLKRARQQTIKSIKAGQMSKLENAAKYGSNGIKDGQ